MRTTHILGLNARTQVFWRYNKPLAKKYANSKLATKRILRKHDVPVPEIFAKFVKPEKIESFDWSSLPDAFALKPNRGLGGEGIVVVKKRALDDIDFSEKSILGCYFDSALSGKNRRCSDKCFGKLYANSSTMEPSPLHCQIFDQNTDLFLAYLTTGSSHRLKGSMPAGFPSSSIDLLTEIPWCWWNLLDILTRCGILGG